MSGRYPQVKFWALWNEPNLDGSFSPQPPLTDGYLWNEYMYMIGQPGAQVVRANIPDAKIVGPDLHTCYDTGQNCEQVDQNWGYHTRWNTGNGGWAWSLYGYWGSYFDIFSIHNYSSDYWGVGTAIGDLWNYTMQYWHDRGQPYKYIWTTEVNFRKGTLDTSEPDLAYNICRTYRLLVGYWERSFHFDLADNPAGTPGCCLGLLRGPDFNYVEKSFLYPAFQAIVNGTYSCP